MFISRGINYFSAVCEHFARRLQSFCWCSGVLHNGREDSVWMPAFSACTRQFERDRNHVRRAVSRRCNGHPRLLCAYRMKVSAKRILLSPGRQLEEFRQRFHSYTYHVSILLFTFALSSIKKQSIESHVKAFALNVVGFYAPTFCFMLDTSNKNTLGAFLLL